MPCLREEKVEGGEEGMTKQIRAPRFTKVYNTHTLEEAAQILDCSKSYIVYRAKQLGLSGYSEPIKEPVEIAVTENKLKVLRGGIIPGGLLHKKSCVCTWCSRKRTFVAE